MNRFFYFIFICCSFFSYDCFSQSADSVLHKTDTPTFKTQKDTIHLESINNAAQLDSALQGHVAQIPKKSQYQKIIEQNKFLCNQKTPVERYQKIRKLKNQTLLFYIVAGFFFFMGILRVAFGKYFNNLFKVFFNTSFRQSQITDQLLQDKLPSLMFNLFFVMSGGMYIFLMLVNTGKILDDEFHYFYFGMATIGLVYFTKYLALHIIGWLSGFRRDTEIYIFIVFLINKILAIALLPVIAIMAFGENNLKQLAIQFSILLIGFMIILRYLRAYSVIQQSLKVSKFHFLLYIITVELLPILLICHIAWNFISKSL